MQATELRRAVEHWGQQITAEPVYVMFGDELPAAFEWQGAGGWAADLLDLALSDHLIGANRWRGRGCAFVLQRIGHDAELTDTTYGELLHVAAHELAHAVDFRTKPSTIRDTPLEKLRATPYLNVVFEPPKLEPLSTHERFELHDASWLRCYASVTRRLERMGIRPPRRLIGLDLARLGFNPLGDYLRRLPETELDVPLYEVLRRPAPWRFTEYVKNTRVLPPVNDRDPDATNDPRSPEAPPAELHDVPDAAEAA